MPLTVTQKSILPKQKIFYFKEGKFNGQTIIDYRDSGDHADIDVREQLFSEENTGVISKIIVSLTRKEFPTLKIDAREYKYGCGDALKISIDGNNYKNTDEICAKFQAMVTDLYKQYQAHTDDTRAMHYLADVIDRPRFSDMSMKEILDQRANEIKAGDIENGKKATESFANAVSEILGSVPRDKMAVLKHKFAEIYVGQKQAGRQ